ncbi:MAG: hydrogenase expression protein HypE, partial [Candidatus Saccharimonadales bacterium]
MSTPPAVAAHLRRPAIETMNLLWITAGLGCDGDTIAITAATQPSLEDLLRGVLPDVPRLNFHNPVLAYENGDEYLDICHRAAYGKLDRLILVVEGSIPDEKNKAEGFWAAMG